MSIKSIHIQKFSWREYVVQYGQDGPKMVDGTHGTSQHGNVSIPWTLVDGLNRSFIGGITLNLTENSDSILEGAHLFFRRKEDATPKSTLISPESAMLTDEGSAYPKIARELQCVHLFDRKHFTESIAPSLSHLSPGERQKYHSMVYSILDATTAQEFNSYLQSTRIQFHHPNVNKLLDNICKTFVTHYQYLTLSHVVSDLTYHSIRS
jgi:hypothetical protein